MANLKTSTLMRQAMCGPQCGFLIRSTDEAEIVRATKAHVKAFHEMDLTDEQARANVRDAGA